MLSWMEMDDHKFLLVQVKSSVPRGDVACNSKRSGTAGQGVSVISTRVKFCQIRAQHKNRYQWSGKV